MVSFVHFLNADISIYLLELYPAFCLGAQSSIPGGSLPIFPNSLDLEKVSGTKSLSKPLKIHGKLEVFWHLFFHPWLGLERIHFKPKSPGQADADQSWGSQRIRVKLKECTKDPSQGYTTLTRKESYTTEIQL